MTRAALAHRFMRFTAIVASTMAVLLPLAAHAQDRPARFLGHEDIVLYGIGLKVEPSHQTLPKDIATIVSTYLQTPQLPANVPPFAPDAVIKATLRGPSFATPQELTIAPNTPFNIPPLTVAGTHTLEDIRLISGGEVLLRGTPDHVTLEVIERLLITQVTARPLTAAEIREKGIVFDSSNFQAYNFSAAFAIQDRIVDLSFPVLLPSLEGARDVQLGSVGLPVVSPAGLPQLRTLIPDTLKLQTQIPNLSVVGFTLRAPDLKGNDFVVPPIPGVIVIPGDIGFLNQYFSVLLMIGNVAPAGSGLEVSDLRAEIVLPPGRDTVVNTADDPLRMAQTVHGESARVQLVVQPGPDGQLGTSDDIGVLRPGDSGNAEYLVEGRREGSHIVEMEISGTLHGLPIGPVQVRGRAAGSVLVRNPKFTLTFTHPEAVSAGEPYTLDVTVTNTSESPANFVNLTLYPRNVSGATVVGEPTRGIESIAPGDSETVTFDLISRLTGKVTAATLDSDEKVAGRFELKAAVGELGVPISPDTLVLPKEAGSLPRQLRDAALGLLGKAYAVATAPAAALPPDVRRFSRKVVIDRAVEVAEAGFRYTLREPLPDSAAQLLMDFIGSNYSRLADLVRPADLAFDQENFVGFDELRRRSLRGDVFARSAATVLEPSLASQGAAPFHYALAQKWSYRPGHLSVLVSSGGDMPVALSVVDPGGRSLGGTTAGKVTKEIAFSDFLPFFDGNGAHVAEMALATVPTPGTYTVRLTRLAVADGNYTVSVIVPTTGGSLRQLVFNVEPGQVPTHQAAPDELVTLAFELVDGGAPIAGTPVTSSSDQIVVDPPPSVVSVIQQRDADQIGCDPGVSGYPAGRVVAVLFSEEVTPASVHDRVKAEDIAGFDPEVNRVVGVALQPGRRIAFVALRDPIGPFIPRQISISAGVDLRGQPMAPFTGPMEITVGPEAGVVNGRVIRADGTPVPFANVRLFYLIDCGAGPAWVGIASKSADGEGRYAWDYVLRQLPDKIVAVDPETEEFRSVPFNIQRDGQRLNVDIVFLGRGTFSGTTRSEAGTVLADTNVRITSLTDGSQYGATTDAHGRFSVARIPVGNLFVEAINIPAHAKFALSEAIPFAGANVDRDITLLDIEQQQITVRHGNVGGRVLRTDGVTPAGGVPVFVWYKTASQPGVLCPPGQDECAVASGVADAGGAFAFADVPAGSLRVSAFDQEGLVQGEARLELASQATVDLNVLLVGGLGTVTGHVLSPDGTPVAGAAVGGGMTLVTTNTSGEFTLTDVPVGRREIVAVSDILRSSGRVTVDLTRAGATVAATIVLDSVGSVSGTVLQPDGSTPAAGAAVYVFRASAGGYEILGSATTNAQGGYRIDGIRNGSYQVSSFNAAFSEGNLVPAVLRFHGQVFRADMTWRGGGGRVVGTVFDDDGQTPLKALVSLSGDQLQIAGGRVGVAFQHVSHYKIAETDFTTGRFALSGAWVGPVTVSAAGQFSPDPIAVSATIPASNATIEVNLRLQPTSQIRGVVLQSNGINPAGANVIVKYKSEAFKVICSTSSLSGEDSCTSIPQGIQEEIVVTDADGRFWLPIVNAGPFTVSVEDPVSGKVGQIKGAVRAGEEADISVRLLGLGELSVQVLGSDTTTPIPGARVVVTQLNHPRKEVEGRADTDGRIVFVGADGFSEGEFAIAATDLRNGFAGRGTARITRDGDQVSVKVYLYDSAGAVSGRIYASNGLTPVPNAEIVLSNNAGPLAFALSAVDGSYRVETVPLGDFRIEAFEARTARRATASGRMDLAGQEVPLNLIQSALGVVKGRLSESASLAPLKGWTITLGQRSASGLGLGTLQTTSAIDGGYLFPGTAQGTFTLTAVKADVQGSASASGTIEREGETVDVPLLVKFLRPLAGTISGRVVTATGEPAPNRPVEICHAARSCESPVQLTADPDGRFSLPDVPLGRFQVTARSQVTRETGSAQGELSFDGDIASVVVVLTGVSEVRGTVERANGTPAPGVRVALVGLPESACEGRSCVVFSDAAGAFTFVDVPASMFTVTATDPLNTLLNGSAGGALNPGEVKQVRIVLTPTFVVSGRALLSADTPAAHIVAQLITSVDPDLRLFAESGADGVFTFPAVPPGTHPLSLNDPIGPGVASRSVTVAANVALGDVLLDTAAPSILASNPANAATGVPSNTAIRVTFSEPIRPGTITAETVSLSGPAGALLATLDFSDNDSIVTLTPLAPLAPETRYTLRVFGVQDRFGKVMGGDYVATFTSVDITPPAIVSANPAVETGGAPVYSPIRIAFSETIDPVRFVGAPIVLTGPAGAVAGRTDYLFGNTVVVFTPNFPLSEDSQYDVTVARATDLAGNSQAAALSYRFTTTDRTPPQIAALTAANGGLIVENGTTSVVAQVGAANDVGIVDWYINDVLVFADRTAPFELAFRADTALYGPAGSVIRISAIATDTSGNRGDPRGTEITVTPDQLPTVAIIAPADGLSARTGDRIVVRVRATDDLGVTRIGYRALSGNPTDAITRPIAPAAADRIEEFAFYIPTNAAPGTTIAVTASASDTRAQVAQASINITVLDALSPTVTITGATSGARVFPGQPTTVVVTAQDIGNIASVRFTASGIVTSTETRPVDPAQPSIVTAFTVTVPVTARAGQTLILGATATDVAGNTGSAAQVVLPVADTTPPTIVLTPQNGTLDAVPGRTVEIVATAEDEIGIVRIDLTASGAVTHAESKQVSPPVGSAALVFSVPVPASAVPGTEIQVRATATDVANNTSGQALITLTISAPVDVTLPPSAIVDAGATVDVELQLAGIAPAGGVRIDLASDDANVAAASAFVVVPEGQSSAMVRLTGVAGGSTQIRALSAGVVRASITVTVRGGIVSGIVRDAQLNPIAGAQLTVSGGGTQQDVVTDADGRYTIDGVQGPDVSVRALDPLTKLYGHATALMAHRLGYATVNVVLIPAAAVHGTVFDAAGVAAGAGVRVDIFTRTGADTLGTVFTTDDGTYAFPLVTLGDYRIEAAAVDGRRARSLVLLGDSGRDVLVNLVYLGTGTVSGTVRLGSGAVPNARLTFYSWSIFGPAPVVERSAEPDGTFSFTDVAIGSFSIVARDEATGQAGSASGSVTQQGQAVTANVQLSTYGAVEGRIFRADGVTPVAGATVRLGLVRQTTTDPDGHYRFDIIPLNTYPLEAEEPSTGGYALGSVALVLHGTTKTVDLSFLPQARVVVTVTNPGGATVQGAFVYATSELSGKRTSNSTQTGADGTALVDRLFAGAFSVSVSYGAQRGYASGTLLAGELRQIAIELSPTGSITGTIYEADGQTPAAGARVSARGVIAPVITGADGTYRFDALALGSYALTVYDVAGRLRARTFNAGVPADPVVASAGQVVTRDLTFIGLGTVTGRVINPGGSSAQGMGVQLWSGTAGFQVQRWMQTDGGGFYTFEFVPAGSVTVVASDLARQLYGERTGTIDRHDGSVQLDIALTSNAITLPRTLYDANNVGYDVLREGYLRYGFFYGNGADEMGGLLLDITSGGTTTRFSGPEVPTIEDGGREIAVRQENLAGLSVTRKVFVPKAGYFARYLEIFRNPTAAPIAIDVDLTSYPSGLDMGLTRTSSGDAALALDDNWIVTSQTQGPSAALVFQGDNAVVRAGAASFVERSSYIYQQWARAAYGWRNLTIGAGETVALMHFGVQQLTPAAALASVQRLAQLPPEAISGLSPEEFAAVRNFTLPDGGVSAVSPLPSLTGRIAGHVFEHDATTPVPYAAVRFTSGLVLFGREQWVSANAEGVFDFTGVLEDSGGSLPIPATGFTLVGRHASSYVMSPAVSGTIQSETVPNATDITFTNTSIVTGTVRRQDGTAVQSGNVYLYGPAVPNQIQGPIGADAVYRFTGIPAGTYQMTTYVAHPQGTVPPVSQTVQVVAGRTYDIGIVLPPTGSVTGTVRTASGLPVPNAQLYLSGSGFYRYASTDSGGAYALTELPEGTVSLTVTDPRTNAQLTASVNVARGTATPADFTLPAVGSIRVQVNLASGQPASQSLVYLNNYQSAYTDGLGVVVFANVTAGTYTVRATHPSNSDLSVSADVTVVDEGGVVPVAMTLPAAGQVVVTVTRGAGVLVTNSQVMLSQAGRANQYRATDSSGTATFAAVGSGALTVRATHPQNSNLASSVTGAIVSEGQSLELAVVLPPIGTVTGTVRQGTTAVSGLLVSLRSSSGAVGTLTATTNASGGYTIAGVPGGPFTVTVEDFTRSVYGTAAGQILVDLETVNVDIALVNNVVQLGTNLFDGNSFLWDIAQSGQIADGSNDAYDGGLNLRVRQGTSSVLFSGAASGLTEDAGREIAIRQAGIFGLDVTRKIFVPADGYFARFLEVLNNPGASAVTVDVAIESNLGSDGSTVGVVTSSGDTTFGPEDLWVVTDDNDNGGDPSLAHVIGGASARRVVSIATRSGDNLQYRWNSIVIQPGETVILMHFAAQHFTRLQVRTAGERLVQLPPEAIAGLSPEEIAAISNFAVPSDSSSPLPEVHRPALGTVTGHVYGPDGVTPVASVQVAAVSANVLFGRGATVTADASGSFTIPNVVIDSYLVSATFSPQSLVSPAFSGSFDTGQVTATTDVVFSNAGSVRGSIRDAAGAVFAANGSLSQPYYVPVTAGQFAFPLVAPGTRTVNGSVNLPQGGSVTVSGTAEVVAGQAMTFDLPLPPLGQVTGTVTTASGAPAPNVSVSVYDLYYFQQTATTGAAGEFTFTHVPAGLRYVRAYHPQTGVPVYGTVTVVANQSQVVDLQLEGAGTVSGVISNPDGSPTANTTVELRDSTYNFQRTTTADADGHYTFTDAPSGTLTLRAYAQGFNGSIYREVTAPGPADGAAVTINLTVQAVATVRVLTLDASGNPLSGNAVYYRPSYSNYENYYGSTNAAGYFDLTATEGSYSVSSYFYPSGLRIQQAGQVLPADHGRTIVHTLRARVQGTVSGIVYAGDGQTRIPYPFIQILEGTEQVGYAYGNELGEYNSGLTWLPSAPFTLRAWVGQAVASAEVSVAVSGTSIQRDFTLPVSIIKGTVTFADGLPVEYPEVFATSTTPDPQATTYYALFQSPTGEYVIAAPPGTYDVMARTYTGLTARGTAVLADTASTVILDLRMPPTGTVTTELRRASGDVAPYENVWLMTAGLESPVEGNAQGDGRYTFETIPLGPFSVQACLRESQTNYCDTVTGELTSAGQSVTANITMTALGSLRVTVVDALGNMDGSPEVHIDGTTRHVRAVEYDANPAVFAAVPEGPVTIRVVGSGAYGIADATIVAGAQTDIEVRLGTATYSGANLIGTAGFDYYLQCHGAVYGGSNGLNGWDGVYYPVSMLYVNSRTFPCLQVAVSEEDGREQILGPAIPGADYNYDPKPLAVATRKVFSPTSGAFLRYFDQVTSTAPVTQTFTVRVDGSYGGDGPPIVVAVTPLSTSNTYGVLTAGTLPATAFVFAGIGAPNAPAVTMPGYSYTWTVTLAPGQSVALLHYVVPAAPGDVADAQARALALATLADPEALQGLSADELALIINFVIGGGPGG